MTPDFCTLCILIYFIFCTLCILTAFKRVLRYLKLVFSFRSIWVQREVEGELARCGSRPVHKSVQPSGAEPRRGAAVRRGPPGQGLVPRGLRGPAHVPRRWRLQQQLVCRGHRQLRTLALRHQELARSLHRCYQVRSLDLKQHQTINEEKERCFKIINTS